MWFGVGHVAALEVFAGSWDIAYHPLRAILSICHPHSVSLCLK